MCISLLPSLPLFALLSLSLALPASASANDPPVTIAILVRNKAYALPYSLGAIERLDYNAIQLSFVFYVDHSSDASAELLHAWQSANWRRYARVHIRVEQDHRADVETAESIDWPRERFLHVLRTRQLALDSARLHGSQFAFFLDADALITHPEALRHLVRQNTSLIAPLLNCSNQPEFGANFWGDIDPNTGFYRRSENYMPIRNRERLGLFPVPVVHTAFLLSLTDEASANFRFYPLPDGYPDTWPIDDMPLMNAAARAANLQQLLDNRLQFGVYSSLDEDLLMQTSSPSAWLPAVEAGGFLHALTEFHYLHNGLAYLDASPALASLARRQPHRLGFDRVYLINLARRPDRLARMRYALDLLGIDWQLLEAIDGRQLNASWLAGEGIKPLAGYADPYHGRGLTLGEIGCFLSHHAVWRSVVDEGLSRVLVLEDDVRFGYSFEARLAMALEEADRLVRRPAWELLYLGRKIMHSSDEARAPGASFLVRPAYTYWTLGYALTQSGAKKLLDQRPLDRMVAVDEYLPIMFDRHPNAEWKAAFKPRNLVALSASPLLLEPNYYVGMPQYVSDTERSDVAKHTQSSTCSASDGGNTCSNPGA